MDFSYISQAYKQLVSLPSIPVDFTAIRFDSNGIMYSKVLTTEHTFVTTDLSQNLTNKTINKLTITAPTTSATLTILDGKTLTANNSLIFSGTDGSTLNIGTGGTLGSNAYTSTSYAPIASPTFTTKIITPVIYGSASASGTLTIESTSNATKATAGILMSDGIASTTTTTGTLVVTGGLGISGAVNIGSYLVASGSISGTSLTASDCIYAHANSGNALIIYDNSSNSGMYWDGNGYMQSGIIATTTYALNLIDGYTSTPTSSGTLTLTINSNKRQFFTGTSVHTLVMPVVSTLRIGQTYVVTNISTQTITINSSGGNLILSLPTLMSATITCILTSGTTASSWNSLVHNNSISGSGLSATGSTTGATSQSQVFTNGVTLSNITANSILFAGTSGVVSQDNANLSWNNTNKFLGIGVSPTSKLHVVDNTNSNIATFSSTVAWAGYTVSGGTTTTGINGLSIINSASYQYNIGLTGDTNGIANTLFVFNNANTSFPLRIFNTDNIGLSSSGSLSTGNILNMIKTNTGTVQCNIQNASNGTSASSDYVATADTGTDSTNYIDIGINSSTYTDSGYTINGALGGYLYNLGGDLSIGTATTAKVIKFHTAGTLTANERARITDTGLLLTGYLSSISTSNFTGIGTGLSSVTIGNGTTGGLLIMNDISGATEAFGTAGYNLTFYKQRSTDSTYYQTFQVVGGSASSYATGYNFNIGTTTLVAINSSGSLNLSANVASTSTTTGSLIVTGGAGFSGNVFANNVVEGYTTTATASGTTTLTVASTNQQYFTGTSIQTIQMPVTSTLTLGLRYVIVNNSTGVLTINSSGGNFIGTVPAGRTLNVTCILTSGTTAASWFFNIANSQTTVETWSYSLSTNLSIYLGAGSGAAWAGMMTLFSPNTNMSFSTSSTIKSAFTTVATGNYILAVYKYVAGGPHTLMFTTSSTAIPGVIGHVNPTVSNITDGNLIAGTWYYFAFLLNANGPSSMGIANSTTTIKPSRTMAVSSVGNAITVAPSTIADTTETSNGMVWFKLQV